ncbi:MAG: hypothetical protein ACRYHA_00480 [Janthinobacterium lividum]
MRRASNAQHAALQAFATDYRENVEKNRDRIARNALLAPPIRRLRSRHPV